MTLRTSRLGRPGVIDQPVARTSAVAISAEAVALGVERRRDSVAALGRHEQPTPSTRSASTDP